MAMKYEDFIEVLREVSESKGLNSDNILKRVQDKLKERSDENGIDSAYTIVYNTFKSNSFYKNHEFKLQMSDGTTALGTLLHFAIQCNNKLLVKLLLENELSIVMKNHSGLSPLHIAASHGYEEIVQLLLDDKRVNPLLEDDQGRTPKDVVGTIDNIQNKEIIVKRLETAEKNYSPKKTKDPIIKTEGGGRYRLSQNNHKTQAGLAVNVGNVTSAPANVIDPHLERCDSIHSDGSVSGYSSLESEQSETTSIRKLENELKEPQEQEIKNLKSENAKLKSELEEIKNQHSKHVAENENRQEAFDKLYEENKSLKQKMQDLENENTTLKDKLEENKDQHSKYVAKNETRLKTFDKLYEENKLLKQETKNLKSENAKLKGELENKDQHSKTNEVLLKKAQEKLAELTNRVAEHKAELEALNKQNQEKSKLLEQEIKNLRSENAKLNSELEKNKNQHSQTSEVSLKKVEKKPPLSKVAYVSLVATSVVGSIFSIVSGLSVLLMIATSVTSALVAGGITYKMSKPTTELKEVNIQSPGNNKACEI